MTKNRFEIKWSLSFKIIPVVLGIVVVKLFFHYMNWEFIQLSALFTCLVTGTVFLMGFLLSGVLSDYKESEKIPIELVVSLETMADEVELVYMRKRAPEAREFMQAILAISKSLREWFYKKEGTPDVLRALHGFNRHILAFEDLTQANFVSRLKKEQRNLRRLLLRAHAVRETTFIQSGYAIAEIISWLLFVALLFIQLDPFYESLFFIIPIAYLFTYMLALIRDLNNPFDYASNGTSAGEVSIREIHACIQRLYARVVQLDEKVG